MRQLTFERQYLENISCIFCSKQKLRLKDHKDWGPMEKVSRGYYPKNDVYLFCDFCKRTSVVSKKDFEVGGVKV